MSTDNTTTRNVRLHTDNSVAEHNNHRLAVIRWKATTEQPKPPAARFVSVPRITLAVEPDVLQAAMVQAFEDLQDALIRSLIVAKFKSDPATVTFTIDDSQIDANAVATYANEQATSDRMSKSKLENWFNTMLADKLTLALGKAMQLGDAPSNADLEKLTKALDSYRSVISGFASPRASYSETVLTQVSKAIAYAPENDVTREAITKKIEAFRKPREQTLLESL